MREIVVTKLQRDADGVWTARASFDGNTVPVTRFYGSWGTIPVGGRWQDLPREVAAALQKRVRTIETRERQEAAREEKAAA